MRWLSILTLSFLTTTSAVAASRSVQAVAGPGEKHESFGACSNGHPQFPGEHFRITNEAWPLYAWTAEPFDPAKPSVLFFNGGPGQSSHGRDWKLDGWNVIFWDQRGIACSKPESRSAYLDHSNYSISSTADDAVKIVDLFGLQDVSLLAVSYGTAPATVFAHRHPERVRSIVLEGTLANGSRELQDRSHAQKILIRFFDDLSEEKRSQLRAWSKIPGISPTWYSRVGYYFLQLNDGLSKFDLFLDRVAEMGFPDPSFFDNFGEYEFEDDPLGFSAVVFAAIACGELSQDVGGSTSGLIVSDDALLPVEDSRAKPLCAKYGFSRTRDFLAAEYPVETKIIYFQGVLDGATEATQAIEHFHSVPQDEASLYLRVDGGHSPLLGEITDRFSGQMDLQERYRRYLSEALMGEDPDLSAENTVVWKLAKNPGRSPENDKRSAH